MRPGLKEVEVLSPDGATLNQDFSIGHSVGSILQESTQVSLDEVRFSCRENLYTLEIFDAIYDKVESISWGLALVDSLQKNVGRLEVLHFCKVISLDALL